MVESQTRVPVSEIIRRNPIVAVLRARRADDCGPAIEALANGGIRSIELTLSSEGVFDYLPRALQSFGDDLEIGVGTITSRAEAERALDLGANFLVTPIMDRGIVELSVARGTAIFPGGYSPTELYAGWKAGATAVKLFPASTVGPGYIPQLRGPFPDIQVIPSGGIRPEDAAGWITAGATAVSIGGPLIRDALTGGDLNALTMRSSHVSDLVAEAVSERMAS